MEASGVLFIFLSSSSLLPSQAAIYNNKKSTMRYETILPWDDTSLFQALMPYRTLSLILYIVNGSKRRREKKLDKVGKRVK